MSSSAGRPDRDEDAAAQGHDFPPGTEKALDAVGFFSTRDDGLLNDAYALKAAAEHIETTYPGSAALMRRCSTRLYQALAMEAENKRLRTALEWISANDERGWFGGPRTRRSRDNGGRMTSRRSSGRRSAR